MKKTGLIPLLLVGLTLAGGVARAADDVAKGDPMEKATASSTATPHHKHHKHHHKASGQSAKAAPKSAEDSASK